MGFTIFPKPDCDHEHIFNHFRVVLLVSDFLTCVNVHYISMLLAASKCFDTFELKEPLGDRVTMKKL